MIKCGNGMCKLGIKFGRNGLKKSGPVESKLNGATLVMVVLKRQFLLALFGPSGRRMQRLLSQKPRTLTADLARVQFCTV